MDGLFSLKSLTNNGCNSLSFVLDGTQSVKKSGWIEQVDGHATAFRDEEILSYVDKHPQGVEFNLIAITQASVQMIPWRHIRNRQDMLAFADEVSGLRHRYPEGSSTNIYDAMRRSIASFQNTSCQKQKTMDLSSDGNNRNSFQPSEMRDLAESLNITINAIALDQSSAKWYLETNVKTPDGQSFVANGDYVKTLKEKILFELTSENRSIQTDPFELDAPTFPPKGEASPALPPRRAL